MIDVIIVGAGPAGVSAALYLQRFAYKTLIFNHQKTAMAGAKIENYYGFEEGISGDELFEKGIQQAKNLGADVLNEEVLAIEYLGNDFIVKTKESESKAKVLVLAIGQKKRKPRIENIDKFEAKGLSYCAVCDGFFYKDQTVGVLGTGDFALHEANYLSNLSKVILFTDGKDLPSDFETYQEKIVKINGDEKLESVTLGDGKEIPLAALFIAMGSAGADDFANQLGLISKDSVFLVDEDGKTNVDGCYAIGDCTGGLLQIATAVNEGAKAAIAINKYIRSLKE